MLAQDEHLSVPLAQEMVEMLEDRPSAVVVRDEGDARLGLQWQINVFADLEAGFVDVNTASVK